MKTTKQLYEMYRDIKDVKHILMPIEDVQQFVDYCYDVHDLIVCGGALSDDGKFRFLYID